MIKKTTPVLMLIALLGLNALPVHAARSHSKSYKVSVTLPSSVNIPVQSRDSQDKEETISTASSRQTSEEMIIVRNTETILLRTIVAQ